MNAMPMHCSKKEKKKSVPCLVKVNNVITADRRTNRQANTSSHKVLSFQ